MSNKFVTGDPVRVTNPNLQEFDRVGVVTGYAEIACEPASQVQLDGIAFSVPFKQSSLTLADPWNTAVLDEMDAESAPDTRGMVDGDAKSEGAPERTGITANDKLRLIADTVERQPPFGTELANFRRRLSAILSIGHDA